MDCMNRNSEENNNFETAEQIKEQKVERELQSAANRMRHLFNCGYETGSKEAKMDWFERGHNRGADDAWKLITDVAGMAPELRHSIFGIEEIEIIINDMTYGEVAARTADYYNHLAELQKLKATEPIKAGDYIIDESGRPGLVTNADTAIHVMYDDGKTHKWSKSSALRKTGESGQIIVDHKA